MKILSIGFCGVLFFAQLTFADDITTTDGKRYENVSVSRVEPDGLVVVGESGILKLPFEILPQTLKEKHGYNPEKAAAFKQASQEALVASEKARREKLAKQKEIAEQLAKAKRVDARVLQVTDEGLLVDCDFDAGVVSSLQSVGGGGGTYAPESLRKPRKQLPYVSGVVLLVGHPKQASLVDRSRVDVDAYENGTYSYVDLRGANRTVKKFVFIEGE